MQLILLQFHRNWAYVCIWTKWNWNRIQRTIIELQSIQKNSRNMKKSGSNQLGHYMCILFHGRFSSILNLYWLFLWANVLFVEFIRLLVWKCTDATYKVNWYTLSKAINNATPLYAFINLIICWHFQHVKFNT